MGSVQRSVQYCVAMPSGEAWIVNKTDHFIEFHSFNGDDRAQWFAHKVLKLDKGKAGAVTAGGGDKCCNILVYPYNRGDLEKRIEFDSEWHYYGEKNWKAGGTSMESPSSCQEQGRSKARVSSRRHHPY